MQPFIQPAGRQVAPGVCRAQRMNGGKRGTSGCSGCRECGSHRYDVYEEDQPMVAPPSPSRFLGTHRLEAHTVYQTTRHPPDIVR